jgi:membrane-bound metal-dependent hydrolase YbcI (DUF457 family)
MILGHLACAGIAKKAFFKKENFFILLLFSLLPDLMDKPVSIATGIPGRGVWHSLIIFGVAAAILYFGSPALGIQRSSLFAYLTMWASHLFGDVLKLNELFWPILGPWDPKPGFDAFSSIYRFYWLRLYPEQLSLDLICVTTFFGLLIFERIRDGGSQRCNGSGKLETASNELKSGPEYTFVRNCLRKLSAALSRN